jgi:outer membrane protein OmpA-like peptidoglycan-associated protein
VAPDAAATEEPAVEAAEAPVELTPEELAAKEAVDAAALAAAEAELKVNAAGELVDPAAGLKTAAPEAEAVTEPVEAPVPTETEVENLTNLLVEPSTVDPVALGAAETLLAAPLAEGEKPADQAPSADAIATVTETLTEQTQRSSTQEFAAAPVAVAGGKRKNRLSDLEKVGLVALGALVVGAIIKDANNKQEDRRVVSNTGDRVVVLKPDGTYQVYKDDDTIIRRPGSDVRTETYRDGSTRTIVKRADGTQVVTIRDASGRVLRRAQYDDLGRELVLIDDLEPEEVVVIRDLPKPRKSRVIISSQDEDAEIQVAMAAKEVARVGRKFSLRQIREIPEVRALAATIDVDAITFDSGSAAIRASEADDLADLGDLMQSMLDKNPREMFLIEGHTDATGAAAMNLALSDRRAESVALALTEYFDIPPENMVIQGYGETELRIDTLANEKRNRRVAVRIITPLLRQAALK